MFYKLTIFLYDKITSNGIECYLNTIKDEGSRQYTRVGIYDGWIDF